MRISCVIPTHLRNDFLRESLESVAKQSIPADEVIVVSDVQDEEAERITAEIMRRAGLRWSFIDNSSGGGASSSRNAGARAAKGDYIAFLDDDDLWEKDYLSRVVEELGNGRVAMVVTWITRFRGAERQDGASMRRGLLARDAAAVNQGATGSNIVVSKEVFDALGGFDTTLPVKNDTDFLYRFLQAEYPYGVVQERGVLQRKHDQGQLMAMTEKRAKGAERYYAKHKGSMAPREQRRVRASIHRIRAHSARNFLLRGFHALCVFILSWPEGRVLLRDYREPGYFKVASKGQGS